MVAWRGARVGDCIMRASEVVADHPANMRQAVIVVAPFVVRRVIGACEDRPVPTELYTDADALAEQHPTTELQPPTRLAGSLA